MIRSLGPATEFDLDPATRAALDFDELLGWIAGFARTAPGRDRVRALCPLADREALTTVLALLRETDGYLTREGAIVPAGLPDPSPGLEGLGVAGRALEPTVLRDLAACLATASEIGASLRRVEATACPLLRSAGTTLPDLRGATRDVLRGITADGTVDDDASGELRSIRRARNRATQRLRRLLEGYLQRPGAEAVIRDDFVTQRNGRFVIPVRADAPRPVPGIVHASSSSGATRFVEPLETVELNNELVRLAELEQQEIARILLEWTEALRYRSDEIERSVEQLAELDAVQARALFGREIGGTIPELETDGPLAFEALRHPLLARRLVDSSRECVPMTLAIEPYDRVLVLSGPNAGGKTIALKTIGLAVLMAQTGIPLPARTVRVPPYRQVRADIGDHQSMQADLSTFSAHITAVAGFLAGARPPLLLLLDEIGTGTDPAEGAALARATLEASSLAGVTAVATTHQGSLKAWALAEPRAMSAALEFDTARLAPTYRVIPGTAGISAGLEIAERVGLQPGVVARARSLLGEEGRQAEGYLGRLHAMQRELERRLEEVEAQRRETEESARRLHERLEEEASKRRRESERRLERTLAEFRRKAEKELSAVGQRRARLKAEGRFAALEAEARRAQAGGRENEDPEAGGAWIVPERLEPGMRVRVVSLRQTGTVLRISGANVQVRLGRVPFTVDRSELRVATVEEPRERESRTVRAGRGSAAPVIEEGSVASELVLIGKTVDEALAELDKYLDDAAVAALAEVRVVHGHGTGRLRKAVRAFLTRHVHVGSQRPGRPEEGGDGATVVTLR